MSQTFPPYPAEPEELADSPEIVFAKQAVQSVINTNLYIARRKNMQNFDTYILENLRLITASGSPGSIPNSNSPVTRGSTHPTALFEITATKELVNLNNVLHGGAAATIFDMTTAFAMAPIQREGFWDFLAGVTRTLNLSYLKPVHLGTVVRVRNWVVGYGKTACMMRAQMESVDGKTVFASCEQHKIHVEVSEEHLRLRREMMEERAKSKVKL